MCSAFINVKVYYQKKMQGDPKCILPGGHRMSDLMQETAPAGDSPYGKECFRISFHKYDNRAKYPAYHNNAGGKGPVQDKKSSMAQFLSQDDSLFRATPR